MDLSNLLLMIAIAAAAYYLGYRQGCAAMSRQDSSPEPSPLPGPGADHLPGPSSAPASPGRPKGPPPPAAAGDSGGVNPGGEGSGGPVRRSTRPPPAAAGLMDKGTPNSGASKEDGR